MRAARFLLNQWRWNYRHRGRIRGLVRGMLGILAARRGRYRRQATARNGMADVVTFSVVPGVTRLWLKLFLATVDPARFARVLVADCSGGLHQGLQACPTGAEQTPEVRRIPILNLQHGTKLDLFMRNVCDAELVVVSDDDVFWLDGVPWLWAMEQLEAQPGVAVVSLQPRMSVKEVLRGKVVRPMGSSCLVIRREVWVREGLSFRPQGSLSPEDHESYYDTADFAHVELEQRGHRVLIAPEEIQAHLCALEGVSTWSLKVQKYAGQIESLLPTIERRRKTLRVLRFLDALAVLLPEAGIGLPEDLVPPVYLARAIQVCERTMPSGEKDAILSEVRTRVDQIRGAIHRSSRGNWVVAEASG